MDADHHRVRNGTLQHELLEGRQAAVFGDGTDLVLDVDCRLDNRAASGTPVRYGLVVSLEVGLTVQTDVHAEVRQGPRTRAQTRTRIQPTWFELALSTADAAHELSCNTSHWPVGYRVADYRPVT